jgi:hypothetical protein
LALLDDEHVALDFDHCGDEHSMPDWIRNIVSRTYAERSPSGNGIRAIFRGELPQGLRDRKDHTVGLEVFTGSGFVTITGDRFTNNDVAPVDDALIAQLTDKLGERNNNNRKKTLDKVRREDAILEQLYELGMVHKDLGDGRFDILCPFEDEHTTGGGQADTVYFLPHTNGYATGNFNCMHAHCAERPQHEFRAALRSGTHFEPISDDVKVIPIEWLSDIKINLAVLWAIKGLLPRIGLVVVFGQPSSGKTFLVIDMGCHIALGRKWGGIKVEQGAVIYIAAENPMSVKNRAAVWRDLHAKDEPIPFGVIPHALNLRDPNEPLSHLIEWLDDVEKRHGRIGMIVIDTLARVMGGGDENTATDMGAIVSTCDILRERYKTLIMLVHHAGKNQKAGARGSSALTAGVDTEIEIEARPGDSHYATWRKQRDGETGFSYQFELEECDLGMDPDGDPVTNCHVVNLKRIGFESTDPGESLTDRDTRALARLKELIDSHGNEIEITDIFTEETSKQIVVSESAWRSGFEDDPLSNTSRDANRVAVGRAVDKLVRAGYVVKYRDGVYVSNTTNNEHT